MLLNFNNQNIIHFNYYHNITQIIQLCDRYGAIAVPILSHSTSRALQKKTENKIKLATKAFINPPNQRGINRPK